MDVSREEIKMMLDRMAANLNLEVAPDVALNDGKYLAARIVLIRMGLNPDHQLSTDLLAPVKAAGQQRMLMGQRLSIRSAALAKRKGSRHDIWTGFQLE
jgi:hypothetical protein